VEQIIKELEVHATIEEEIYYPAVEAKAKKDGKELIAEAVEEHHVVKILLGELSAMSAEDEAFDAKVTVLMENVRHHVEEEEEELLPQSEEILGDEELTRLGEEMAARKMQLGAD
jgi:hemerythrin-like domain-containing protein